MPKNSIRHLVEMLTHGTDAEALAAFLACDPEDAAEYLESESEAKSRPVSDDSGEWEDFD